jgi:hypothetical protein
MSGPQLRPGAVGRADEKPSIVMRPGFEWVDGELLSRRLNPEAVLIAQKRPVHGVGHNIGSSFSKFSEPVEPLPALDSDYVRRSSVR